jgi:hypothetical protein
MAADGKKTWSSLGRNRWPLTPVRNVVDEAPTRQISLHSARRHLTEWRDPMKLLDIQIVASWTRSHSRPPCRVRFKFEEEWRSRG